MDSLVHVRSRTSATFARPPLPSLFVLAATVLIDLIFVFPATAVLVGAKEFVQRNHGSTVVAVITRVMQVVEEASTTWLIEPVVARQRRQIGVEFVEQKVDGM